MDVCVVCSQLEVSATGRSLVQRSPTECGVSECDCEASIIGRPWPTRGCYAIENIICLFLCSFNENLNVSANYIKNPKNKFHKNHPVGVALFHADGRT
jgi:hypothetical protein